MSDKGKNLLNEQTVRRFMNLANLHPLAETFVDNKFEEEEEEEEVQEGAFGAPPEEEEDIEAPIDDMGDMGMEDEPAVEEPAGLPSDPEELALHVATIVSTALSDALNVDIDVEGAAGEEAPEDEELPMDDLGPEPGEEPGEEIPELDEVEVIDDDTIVSEVLRRVITRLKR